MALPENLYAGTSSFSAPSWLGHFYPADLPPGEWLHWYSSRFRTVEIDATWYRAPARSTVREWDRKTPDEFVFAAKVPRLITHERVLEDCERELLDFATSMALLGPKLGALLLQFPYFAKAAIPTLDAFLERLCPFLDILPRDIPFALEVRNKSWLRPALFEALRLRGVALVWVDHPWMPRPFDYLALRGGLTAGWLYLRMLGDRRRIEQVTTEWHTLVVDRSRETRDWCGVLGELTPRLGRIYTYYNNHYAGCAYRSVELLEQEWERREATRPMQPEQAGGVSS